MVQVPEFILDFDLSWRIFEGAAVFEDEPGTTAKRDFLLPLAAIGKRELGLEAIQVDADGDGVTFVLRGRPCAIRCRGLALSAFVAALNEALHGAGVERAFAIVESQRYELRGALLPAPPRLARGTLPP